MGERTEKAPMSTPWRVMIWKIVRSPSLPRNMGSSSTEMLVVVLEKDHQVIDSSTAYLSGSMLTRSSLTPRLSMRCFLLVSAR